MKWLDTHEIAIELEEKHPDVDILSLSFVNLRSMVVALEGFSDNPGGCNEKILESILTYWMSERD